MKSTLIAWSACLVAAHAAEIDFPKEVKPILELHCVSCHADEKPKGDLKLTTRAEAIKGGENGPSLVPGKPSDSPLYTLTILPADHDDIMPPKGAPLTKDQTEKLRLWIEQGAKWPDDVKLKAVKKVDFVRDIQPILEFSCVSCHREGDDDGDLRLETRELAIKGGSGGTSLVPGDSSKSTLYTLTILAPDHDDLMPPAKKGGPLPKEQTDLLRDWIDQGAQWPDGIVLTAKKAEVASGDGPAISEAIWKDIMARLDVTNEADMKPYKVTIPGSDVTFEMVPIKGGEFIMGSPDGEPSRQADEGPQHRVKISPFWMGKFEVTWNEYELFQFPEEEKKRRMTRGYDPAKYPSADIVSRPTTPYVEMSFGMGKDGYPAISMTQHGANTYCKWLSSKLGQFFRLPTEAEWEYAARAGTTTAYSFGDDPAQLGDYAWYIENSDSKYQKVGKKKPNPWGLHDIHGNVGEWCLDQYQPEAYMHLNRAIVENPWVKATNPYPHVVRGGSWNDDPDKLRSSVRLGSDRSWKMQDPQLPKSIWYLTDAQFLGFRLVRPLHVPATAADAHKYWTSGVERE